MSDDDDSMRIQVTNSATGKVVYQGPARIEGGVILEPGVWYDLSTTRRATEEEVSSGFFTIQPGGSEASGKGPESG